MNSPRKISFSAITSIDENFDLETISKHVQKLEKAGFSAFIIKENPLYLSPSFEPLTLLSALSTLTERIGLVATVSTNKNEPYHIARRLASLDHISGGRAGWNIDTNPVDKKITADKETTEQAEEFLQIAKGLWDSYAEGAVVANKQTGVYFLPHERQPLNHKGKYFQVDGPLNLSRSPQGYPVIFHSIPSNADIEFAAKNADVVLTAIQSMDELLTFRKIMDEAIIKGKRSVQLWLEIAPAFTSGATDLNNQHDDVHPNNWIGTAEQIAGQITEWYQSGLIDGFALRLPLNVVCTAKFLNEVLPILTNHGLFRAAKGNTLRELMGIAQPQRNTL